jgi:hypothetical protein
VPRSGAPTSGSRESTDQFGCAEARQVSRTEGLPEAIRKIDTAQNEAGRIVLELPGDEFPRCALFDPIAQAEKLSFALVGRSPRNVFQIVHRRGVTSIYPPVCSSGGAASSHDGHLFLTCGGLISAVLVIV